MIGPTNKESAPIAPPPTTRGVVKSRHKQLKQRQRLNSLGPFQLHQFASQRFHVLLNSLFKVLFNFPSRYFCAIGLVLVFSLGWSLPPALGCIPKQPDSKGAPGTEPLVSTGLTPSLGLMPQSSGLEKRSISTKYDLNTTFPVTETVKDSVLGFSSFARRY